ncbi:MAG: pyridoxamine 5'-phosphate oxidase family protein [Chloroflexi bacterium]|nr:pyridoxamine 5'-phosphate oxidase family protein [Chloroflexota bacterium]
MGVHWGEFARAAPELAQMGHERFERTGAILVGSIRRDGTPRISPVEHLFFDGRLFLGMMWQSRKALDLLRDPRCLVHSMVVDKNDPAGEFKLRGQAREVQDPEVVKRYCQALLEKINWRPDGPFHLFAVEIERATFIQYQQNGDQLVKEWRPGEAPSERLRRWTGSGVVDD